MVEVRISWPVPPIALLDAVTNRAGRVETSRNHVVSDGADVRWYKRETGDPPALCVLQLEDPDALELVVDFMDREPWPMDGRWCWSDDGAVWHTVG
jgi:hypothetical protein